MSKKAILLTLGALTGVGVLFWASGKVASEELCKPVVPQVVIDAQGTAGQSGLTDLMLLYDERGSVPFSRDAFTNNPRFSHCDFEGERCVASRARYEVRLEPERFQSIQPRRNDGEGNRIVGAVRWEGPSYPEQVEIRCDFSESDPRRACRLERLTYAPPPDAAHSYASSHDRCRPGG